MRAFLIDLANEAGELAMVAEAVADQGINITAFAGLTCDESGTVMLMTDDHAATWDILITLDRIVRDMEIVTVKVQPQPGTLAPLARLLADRGVNVEAAIPTAMDEIAFVFDDPATTRKVISDAGYTAD